MSDNVHTAGPRRKLPRSRGATSGLLILLLGAWGALIPFVGPLFNFSFTPDKTWTWSAARGWLEVLPGAVAVLGGLLLIISSSRAMTVLGAWLAIAAGAWFVVGRELAPLLHLGSPGSPAGSGKNVRAFEVLFMFYALGALLVFLGATAFGRLSVVSLRDVHAAERRQEAAVADQAAAREADERASARAAERDSARTQQHAPRSEARQGNAGYDPNVQPGNAGYDPNVQPGNAGYDPNVQQGGERSAHDPNR